MADIHGVIVLRHRAPWPRRGHVRESID
jgi:hypothetical protein